MNRITKYIIVVLALATTLFGGIFWGQKMKLFEEKERETAQVMLEKMTKVFKMVAVEGYVSEIYDYEAYRVWDISMMTKKALVRVKAKVSVGYDFDSVVFNIDEENRIIKINNFPEPEILSIDHDLDYYDLKEGLFNSFSENDLTRINQKAKEYALQEIEKGPLFDQAKEQKESIISMLEELFNKTGWQLSVNENIRPFKG